MSDPNRAHQLAVEAGKGRMGLRTVETVTWFAPIWMPAYELHLTIAQPGGRRGRQIGSHALVNIYDGIEGRFLARPSGPPSELPVGDATALKPVLRETQIHAPLRKAVEGLQKVTTQSAIERHQANVTGLGLPVPIHSVSIDHTNTVHLPVYIGLLQRDQDRVVAIDGATGIVAEKLSRLLTGQLAHIRNSFRH